MKKANSKGITVYIVILAIVFNSFAGGSKILNKLGSFFPNLTEVAFFVNIFNLYMQVSGFVRSTNELVRRVRETKRSIETVKKQMNSMYESIKNLKEVNLYDMDTWQQPLFRMNMLVNNDLNRLVDLFDRTDYCTLGAIRDYMEDMDNLDKYRKRMLLNRITYGKYYDVPSYKKEKESFNKGQKGILESKLNNLKIKRDKLVQLLIDHNNPDLKKEFNKVNKDIEELESKIKNISETKYYATNKIDSLIDEASDLIVTNLTELQGMEEQIRKIERQCVVFHSAYKNLIDGKIGTQNNDQSGAIVDNTVEWSEDIKEFIDEKDPDKIPSPKGEVKDKVKQTDKSKKKEASHHDITSLQNAINFLRLKQEIIMRDMYAMKSLTMAYILLVECYKKQKESNGSLLFNAGQIRLKNKIKSM